MEKVLVIENEVSEIEKVAQFIEELGKEAALAPDLVFQLNLALEEAVSNVILYAYPQGERHTISLAASAKQGWLVFVLSDTGREFDPTLVADADVTLSAEEREIGGLGIFLVKQIMDTVEYRRIEDKNILTLKKQL